MPHPKLLLLLKTFHPYSLGMEPKLLSTVSKIPAPFPASPHLTSLPLAVLVHSQQTPYSSPIWALALLGCLCPLPSLAESVHPLWRRSGWEAPRNSQAGLSGCPSPPPILEWPTCGSLSPFLRVATGLSSHRVQSLVPCTWPGGT